MKIWDAANRWRGWHDKNRLNKAKDCCSFSSTSSTVKSDVLNYVYKMLNLVLFLLAKSKLKNRLSVLCYMLSRLEVKGKIKVTPTSDVINRSIKFYLCFVQEQRKQQQELDRVKRIWYLSPMRAAKVQASLRIRAVSPEPSLLAHRSSELRGTFRQKARSVTPLNGWACAVEICHDGMLEDTNSLAGAQFLIWQKL